MIDEAGPFLKSLEGSRSQGGPADNTFHNLFEVEQKYQENIDFSNPDDDELRALEEGLIENA